MLRGFNVLTQMHRLVKEAAIYSKQTGERGLTARSVKKVTRVSLPRLPDWAPELTAGDRTLWPSSRGE